jgi:hypothetical protein
MEYVGEIPSLDDVNAIEMIDDIILNYRECFPSVSATDSDEVVLNKATAHMVNNLGFTEAVHRYDSAKKFIDNYSNLGDSKRNYNAVIAFESGVEKLPNVQFANYNDDALKADLEQLMALYKSFNLSHFEILGAEETSAPEFIDVEVWVAEETHKIAKMTQMMNGLETVVEFTNPESCAQEVTIPETVEECDAETLAMLYLAVLFSAMGGM